VKGYYCLNNVCNEITKACATDGDCTGAYYCKLTELICSKACDINSDCNVGYNCYLGECQKARQISNYSAYLFVVIGIPIIVVAAIITGITVGIRMNKPKTTPEGMGQSQTPRIPTPNNDAQHMSRSNPNQISENPTNQKLAQSQIHP
jgi:hypothetical protein